MIDIVTIQDTFEEVISDVNGGTLRQDSFWVGVRKSGENQILNKILVLPGKFEGDVEFKSKGNRSYTINNKYKLTRGHSFIKAKGVSSIGRIGSVIVIGTKSGDLVVHDLVSGEETTVRECHYLDIVEIKVFPSKQVLMTVGLDHQIKLWSVKDWSCIRTFHTLNSANVEFIGRGRNFVNGTQKGELKLWECSSGKVVHTYTKVRNKEDQISRIKVIESEFVHGENEMEFETNNKSVIVGYTSGEVVKFNLLTKSFELMHLNLKVSAMEEVDDHLILGTDDGNLFIYGLKSNKVEAEAHFNPAPVKLAVNKRDNGIIYIYVYNGEETLFMVKYDTEKGEIFGTTYLVGLPEVFKVDTMVYDQELLVGSNYGVMLFK
ncbi:hypothetical protein PSN45_003876 [Yamadazyma tenuis]|uniref:WD40 repeat-like protein n=1 Tax=Candida tenuis (strain ATCC 10573 / BCRC 21748 / CBS 615 / JCM 9827 / NBRC 10315 / NRRL Y-1498 / VKM Y-70) TaxID=590646 RepID=G3B2Y9_CANTC|nr:WD40 repeat-like protein [Yamadazyma tenuis ATCC 10573]EGV64035.1 WD40 repeat-like protein [Yamadazyma tenuis ATCC 10573]WEJ96338.1 hypothetical protein PSN45_003876 [Yamadazyma tenuis]